MGTVEYLKLRDVLESALHRNLGPTNYEEWTRLNDCLAVLWDADWWVD